MQNRGVQTKQNITGTVVIALSRHANVHTVAAEGAGSLDITTRAVGITAAQAVINGTIDLANPQPVNIYGLLHAIVITPTNNADVYSYSVASGG